MPNSSFRISLPLAGGCQCGAVRYRIQERPLTLYCCHCTECQAQSSSAFGMSMIVRREALSVDWTSMRVWGRPTDSGSRTDCHFCPGCGSRLFHVGSGNPGLASVKAGSLDVRDVLRPVGHIWTDSAQPWFQFPSGTLLTARQPETLDEFRRRWREMTESWFDGVT